MTDFFDTPDIDAEFTELLELGEDARADYTPAKQKRFDKKLKRWGLQSQTPLRTMSKADLEGTIVANLLWRIANQRVRKMGKEFNLGHVLEAFDRHEYAESDKARFYLEYVAAAGLHVPLPQRANPLHESRTLDTLLGFHGDGFRGPRRSGRAAGTFSGATRDDGTLAIDLHVRSVDGLVRFATSGAFSFDVNAKRVFHRFANYPTASFHAAGCTIDGATVQPFRATLDPHDRVFFQLNLMDPPIQRVRPKKPGRLDISDFRAPKHPASLSIAATFGRFIVDGDDLQHAANVIAAYFPLAGWHGVVRAGKCVCAPFASMLDEDAKPLDAKQQKLGKALIKALEASETVAFAQNLRGHTLRAFVGFASDPRLRQTHLVEWLMQRPEVDDVFGDDDEVAAAVASAVRDVFRPR